ncbi:MAG TPA: DNA-directed RNA polymerase subunit B [Candidatus Nanoarchaeia archaeon]|nr:DNA-directed RNA polymerase subunit B [Candidatus Nanoarchaeia archaeon]
MVDVYLNDQFIGNVANREEFISSVKEKRWENKLPGTLNIRYDQGYDEILIETASGRARRPLIRVKDGSLLLTKEIMEKLTTNELSWDDLVSQGIIEYLDAAEEEDSYIALNEELLTKDHTHIEISPVVLLGFVTSLIPYSNYGSSSRLIRGSKIQKQSLGLYASNFLIRMDTDVSVLHYPQMPVVKSFMHDVTNYDKHPSGQNITIALMSYEGYNMEDAIVINKGSIQRGLARSTYFRPYIAEELRYSGGQVDEVCIPDKEVKGYKTEHDYRYLEKDGIVYTGAKVTDNEVIIGKTSPPRFLGELEEFSVAASTRRESSIAIRHGEQGIVDMTILTENEEGNKIVQVRLRDQRIPEIGDKFASRHGQKGVIGMVVPHEDMPFSALGTVPDIIFSPHGIPGRMTISHLIEIVAGKTACLSGRYVDGTTFDAENEQDLRKELLTLGFREDGTETFYNGTTGEQLEAKIFTGNIYYLKLKHMAANKLHARASGRIQLLTRQPIEGRAKGGGLRVGEMEKDCFVAHGATLLLKERFDSDRAVIYVCEKCGMLAINDTYKKTKYCIKCGGNVEITPIEMAYAFKLLLDELKSFCIYPKMELKSKY